MTVVTTPPANVPIDQAGNLPSQAMYRWMRDVTQRVGGPTGMGSDDLKAMAEDAQEDAAAASIKAQLAMTANRKTVEVPVDLLVTLLARVKRLERAVRDLEEVPL